MRHKLFKLFWAWEFEKEEKWINEKSAQGLQLIDVGFCRYTFENGTPGEYQYRLELLENSPSNAESVAYLRFLEESGIEHVGTLMRWVYVRQKATEGGFDLYNDLDSRMKHLGRINTLLCCVLPINVWSMFLNLFESIHLGYSVNTFFACLSTVLVCLLSYGIIRITLKREKLKKERLLRE